MVVSYYHLEPKSKWLCVVWRFFWKAAGFWIQESSWSGGGGWKRKHSSTNFPELNGNICSLRVLTPEHFLFIFSPQAQTPTRQMLRSHNLLWQEESFGTRVNGGVHPGTQIRCSSVRVCLKLGESMQSWFLQWLLKEKNWPKLETGEAKRHWSAI